MSFLFNTKGRKVFKVVSWIIAILIIISMVLFFAPGLVELFI